MRSSPILAWLLLAVAILAVLVSRLSRSLGLLGIVATVVLLIAVVGVVRELQRYRSRHGGRDRSAPPKDVTPREPALSSGATMSPRPAGDAAPSVIVIEPPDRTETLTAKLQALDNLRTDGLVTDEEYEAKRSQLIADF